MRNHVGKNTIDCETYLTFAHGEFFQLWYFREPCGAFKLSDDHINWKIRRSKSRVCKCVEEHIILPAVEH